MVLQLLADFAHRSSSMKLPDDPKKPRKKHEPVDERLLSTAGRCFIEDGFGFGIDDILAQSGVAKMSLYVKFQSKYGLIERLLEMARSEWQREIEGVAADESLRGADKILRLLKTLCIHARNTGKRTGIISQALLEFPHTGKADETHQKKDLVHVKARQLQRDLVAELEQLCRETGVENPQLAAKQILLAGQRLPDHGAGARKRRGGPAYHRNRAGADSPRNTTRTRKTEASATGNHSTEEENGPPRRKR